MKLLLAFKGENSRYRRGPGQEGYDGPIHATECVPNWNATLFDDLRSAKLDFDVAFITYESPILAELVDAVRPVAVVTSGPPRQAGHLMTIAGMMDGYDRVVIMRFDFQYRIPITKWPKWQRNGALLSSRDVGWERNKCYHDVVFVVDECSFGDFNGAIDHAIVDGEYHNRIGSWFYHSGLPYEVMYQHGYHMINHPLYALKHFDREPDLANPDPGIIVQRFESNQEYER